MAATCVPPRAVEPTRSENITVRNVWGVSMIMVPAGSEAAPKLHFRVDLETFKLRLLIISVVHSRAFS